MIAISPRWGVRGIAKRRDLQGGAAVFAASRSASGAQRQL